MHILGVDCGGTSTKALFATLDGCILGTGQGGPANLAVNGIAGIMASTLAAARECLQVADVDLQTLQREGVLLSLGVSGAGRERERVEVRQAFQASGFDHVVVSHDGQIALYGALGGDDGVVVIAGTGSIAYGIHRERSSRTGGWGFLLGDEGSAFWVALRALQHVMWGYDGRSRQDQLLLEAVSNYFGLTQVEELISIVYRTPLDRGFIGGFSKEISLLANQGHFLSREILREAGRHLGRLAAAALAELELSALPGKVGACGGLFAAGDWLLVPMQEEIHRSAPQQTLTLPQFDPVVGALLLAAKHFELNMETILVGLRQNL
jgi:N-acetylglucosamine kinase-like BadF-type ATPase